MDTLNRFVVITAAVPALFGFDTGMISGTLEVVSGELAERASRECG